jgi:MFS family permease
MEILIISTMLRGIIAALFQTSSSAFLVDIAEGKVLRSVNSIAQSINSISSLAGPAIGGILYGMFGITIVFLINGVSFIISGISELFIEYRHKKQPEKLSVKIFFKEFGEGIKVIKDIKGLIPMFLLIALLNMIDAPIIPIFLPYVGKQILGFSATNIGLLTSAYTLGAFISGITLATFMKKTDSKKLSYFGIIAAPLFQIVFAFMIFPQTLAFIASTVVIFIYSGILFFMMGFTDSFVNIPILTKIQMIIPGNMRGRVFSIMGIMSSVFIPLGYMIYGLMLDNLAPHYLLLAVSVITLILSFILQKFIPWESFDSKQGQ